MKKLLLLDADVIIDFHSLDLFEKLAKAYEIKVTQRVLREARFCRKRGKKTPIDLRGKVSVIENINTDCLRKVYRETKEARITIDQGEATSIAHMIQEKEDIRFCACDRAAITLMSYMELDEKAMSLERALRDASQHTKPYTRHLESKFRDYIKNGKALRIQYKKLT